MNLYDFIAKNVGFSEIIATILGGGWLSQIIKNRGSAQTRHSDELKEFRKDLVDKLEKVEKKADLAEKKFEAKVSALQRKLDLVKTQLSRVQIEFAQYRAMVRMMVAHIENDNPQWKVIAAALKQDNHSVDRILTDIAERKEMEEAPAIAADGAEARKSKIMVVEDYDDSRKALEAQVQLMGFDVESAADGVEALTLYGEAKSSGSPFDLIILDLAMPNLSGEDVAEIIRSEGDCETRLAFLTGNSETLDKEAAASLNLRGVWKKPVDAVKLKALIQGALAE